MKALAFCMALLGFSACGDEADEYGSPFADYKIKGVVVSSDQAGQPIENIQVIMVDDEVVMGSNTFYVGDTIYTNKDGSFRFDRSAFPSAAIQIRFNDIDGVENGEFASKSEYILFNDSDFKGSNSSWHLGTAEKDMGTVKLTPQTDTSKPEEPEER